MHIDIVKNGEVCDIADIELKKTDQIWEILIFSKTLMPFGKLNCGYPSFWVSFLNESKLTTIKFSAEIDREKLFLENADIVLSQGKIFYPDRKIDDGQWSTRIYIIRPINAEKQNLIKNTFLLKEGRFD